MKNLFDAVREAYSQNEPTPAAGGWQKVSASIRRASVVRTVAWAGGAIAACAACAMLFLRVPDSSSVPVSQPVRELTAAVEAQPSNEVVPTNAQPSIEVQPVKARPRPVAASPLVAQADAETIVFEGNDDIDSISVEEDPVPAATEVVSEQHQPAEPAIKEPQPEQWWANEPAPRKHRRISVGVNASASPISRATSTVTIPPIDFLAILKSSNSLFVNDAFSNNPYLSNNYLAIEPFLLNARAGTSTTSYSHDLPVGLGLVVNYPLTERLSLETGLNYTYLHSVEDANGVLSDQRLNFLGIPLRAEYSLLKGRNFSLYTGAGASVDKCLKATVGEKSYAEKRLQWSAEAFAGVEYSLWKGTSLYLQPKLSYWLTDTDLVIYRTDNPLIFSLDAGLRFHL